MNTFQRKPDERGSAILMVLGLLSLLLILALVFAVTSRNAQIVAEANADQTSAKLLSQSAFNRAIECIFFFQNKGNLLKNSNLEAMMPDNADLDQSMADPATVDTDLFYGDPGTSDTADYLGLQPYIGYVDATADWKPLCLYGEFSKTNHGTSPFALQSDGNPYQAIYYSHRDNAYDEAGTEGENSLYEIVAATTLGKGYRTASDDNVDLNDDTDQFATLLKSTTSSQLQFVEDTDADGHITQRLGFVAFVDGPKFDLNQLVSSKMEEDANEPYIPWVDTGALALGDPIGDKPDYNPFGGPIGDSVYAIMGYDYNDDGIPDSLYDGGKLTEEETVQYGLHPQELQVRLDGSGNAIYAKDSVLKRKNANTPPKWFTLAQLLENDDTDVTKAFGKEGDIFLLSLASGTKDRELRFNGNFTSQEEMEDTLQWDNTTHYATGQEHFLMKANLAYPWGLYCDGACPFGTEPDWDDIGHYLQDQHTEGDLKTATEHFFQEHLGLHYDKADPNRFLFKEGTTDLTPQVLANMTDASDADYETVYMATYGTGNTKLAFNSPSFQQKQASPTTPPSNDIHEPTLCGNERVPAIVGVNVAMMPENLNEPKIESIWQNARFGMFTSSTQDMVYQMRITGGTLTFRPRVTLTLQNLLNEDLTKTNQKYRVIVQGKITPMILGKEVLKNYNNRTNTMTTKYKNMLFIPTIKNIGPIQSNDYTEVECTGETDTPSDDYGIAPGNEKKEIFEKIREKGLRFSIDKTVPVDRASFQGMEYQTVEVAADNVVVKMGDKIKPNMLSPMYTANSDHDFYYHTGTAYAVTIEKIVVMSHHGESVDAKSVSDLAYASSDSSMNLVIGENFSSPMTFGQYFKPDKIPVEGVACRDPRLNHQASQWEWLGGKDNSSLAGSGMTWENYAPAVRPVAGFGRAYVTPADREKWCHVDFSEKVAWPTMESALKNDDSTVQKDWEPKFEPAPATGVASGTYDSTNKYAHGGVMRTTLSTAYCPNAPFTSLWQLGAIHRGVEGQTLNLKKFGTDGTNAISHLYKDGDAWFLDYVNLAELDETHGIRGKFNPNCFNVGAYKYLFANIPANPDAKDTWIYLPRNYNPVDDVLRNEFFQEFVGGTADVNWEDTIFAFEDFSPPPTTTRNYKDVCKRQSWSPIQAFFNFVDINGGGGTSVQCNDRQAEALIGCTAGLLSTRYETYTVIAVGQSVKWLMKDDDMPSDATARADFLKQLANPVQLHDNDWYSILSTQVRLVTLVRDCWFGKFQVLKSQIL